MSANEEAEQVEGLVEASDEMVELSRMFLDAVQRAPRPRSAGVERLLAAGAGAAAAGAVALPLLQVLKGT